MKKNKESYCGNLIRSCLPIPGSLLGFCPVWIPFSVLSPYINMTEPFTPYQRRNKTYDKLKYLPVSRKQYRIVRMGYLFRYIWKLAAAGLAVQCIFAMAIVKYFDIWNIIYVAAIMFVLPLLAGWLMLLEF